jgi:hypothetical protein
MELIAHEITLPTLSTPLYLHNITDVHREAAGCDKRKFLADIATIAKANEQPEERGLHYWIGGGDWNNGIGAKDRRWDAVAVSPEFKHFVGLGLHQAVAMRLVEEAKPIAPWCLGCGRGNHEDGVIRFNDYDPALDVARGLDVNYMGYSAGIRLTIRAKGQTHSTTLIVYWHHGHGAARTKGAKVNMLHGLRDKLDADVFFTGHLHEAVAFTGVRMSLTRRGVLRQVARPRVYVNGGTYLKGYHVCKAQAAGGYNAGHGVLVDYSEKAAYDPAVIGHWGCMFRLKKEGSDRSARWAHELKAVDFR